jgi:hypothetical protein
MNFAALGEDLEQEEQSAGRPRYPGIARSPDQKSNRWFSVTYHKLDALALPPASPALPVVNQTA